MTTTIAEIVLPSVETLRLVMPEIWLVVGMCAVILVPFVHRASIALPTVAALLSLVLAVVTSLVSLSHMPGPGQAVFDGMLTIDPLSQFFKVLLAIFTMLVLVQWLIVNRRDTGVGVYDTPDFMCLLLGATLGMALMASASNLVMIFVATETASMPSFVLAGFRKRQREGSEGSLKYVVFGSASSAVMLYGMSLIYGSAGTLNLSHVAAQAATGMTPLLAVGLAAMFAGIAFKLSAVPLHFWCPDVFEGAPIEVTTFLSVASKGAAVCLLMRVLDSFGAVTGSGFTGIATAVGILGAVTATWGNLLALHQTRIKRLLAYSSIAHAGYMIMAASLLAVAGDGQAVVGAVLFYLFVYLFMNMGAFTVAALISQQTGQEDIQGYAGMINRSPALAVMLALFLLSLFGMPGLGGFAGKVYLMVAMSQAGGAPAYVLIAVLLVNTLISLYYYLRPVYFMVFVADKEVKPGFTARPAGVGVLVVCAVMVLWTGLWPSTVGDLTRDQGVVLRAALPQPIETQHAAEEDAGDDRMVSRPVLAPSVDGFPR